MVLTMHLPPLRSICSRRHERFKGWEIWKDKNYFFLKCVEEGRPLSEKGAPIGRDLLLRMCDYYMNQNDNGVFVRRLVLIRSGEIGE